MPAIHFRTTVDAAPERVYAALATQEGLAQGRRAPYFTADAPLPS
jgi:uncharacterized protein YndB with AHSA1/START domain